MPSPGGRTASELVGVQWPEQARPEQPQQQALQAVCRQDGVDTHQRPLTTRLDGEGTGFPIAAQDLQAAEGGRQEPADAVVLPIISDAVVDGLGGCVQDAFG